VYQFLIIICDRKEKKCEHFSMLRGFFFICLFEEYLAISGLLIFL